MNKLLIILATLMIHESVSAQMELKRKALSGFTLTQTPGIPNASVAEVMEGSPAARSGLEKGDQVLAINGAVVMDANTMLTAVRKQRGGVPTTLTVRKRGMAAPEDITFTPPPAPLESYSSLSVDPVVITNNLNMRLRAFVTRPKRAKEKLPAILFVSWLSCGTIELTDTTDGWVRMLRDVAEKSGCLLLRLEKPGVGDSNGTPCAETDLETELSGYSAALAYLKSRPDVDTSKIILFGGSLGGTLTARVGKGQPIKAYVSAVSVYKTWLEHMIELERRRLQLSGTADPDASEAMRYYIEFYTDFLVYRKTPAEVMRDKPHLARWWYDEAEHQYGRPAEFYYQVQGQNFLRDWARVDAPVLLIVGEHDWIMSADDNNILKNMLNRKRPGQCTLYIGRGMDHHWNKYRSLQDAFNETNGVYDQDTVDFLIGWMRKQTESH